MRCECIRQLIWSSLLYLITNLKEIYWELPYQICEMTKEAHLAKITMENNASQDNEKEAVETPDR